MQRFSMLCHTYLPALAPLPALANGLYLSCWLLLVALLIYLFIKR